jgi:hypothetical protein
MVQETDTGHEKATNKFQNTQHIPDTRHTFSKIDERLDRNKKFWEELVAYILLT